VGLSRDNQLVTLSLLLWGLGEGLFFFIQPWYIGELGAEPRQIGGVLALAGVVTTLTYLPGGILSDRVDRKLTMLGGYVLGTIAAVVMALAQDWRGLIPGLLIYALSGYCIPAIDSFVAHAAEGEDLGRTFTTVFGAYSLGLTPSPAIGGLLVDWIGMRPTYLVSAACFAVALFTVARVHRQPIPDGERRLPVRSFVSHRPFLLLSGLFFLIFFATYLGQPFAPNYLNEVTGLSLSWIGFLGSAHALGAFVLSLWLGRWRPGPRWGLIAAQGLVGLSFVILLRTTALPVLTLAFLFRGAYAAVRSLTTAWMGDLLGDIELGLGFGVLNTVFGASTILAPYLAGWMYEAQPALPFLLGAFAVGGTMLLTGLAALAFRGQRLEAPERGPLLEVGD